MKQLLPNFSTLKHLIVCQLCIILTPANADQIVMVSNLTPANNQLFSEDDAQQTLQKTAAQVNDWQKQQEYLDKWNLTENEFNRVPGIAEQKAFIERSFLKYLDHKFFREGGGQGKNKQSRNPIISLRKALKPEGDLALQGTPIKFKFKAKVFQQQSTLTLQNPWLDCYVHHSLRGESYLFLGKNFDSVDIKTDLKIDFNTNTYAATVAKPLTENIVARIVSQSSQFERLFNVEEGENVNHQVELAFARNF